MKIDVTTVLQSIDGEPLKQGDKDFTLRDVLQTVLLSPMQGDETMTGEDKAKLWNLAADTREDEVDWTPDDLVLVRKRVGTGFGPVVVGPAFQLLG